MARSIAEIKQTIIGTFNGGEYADIHSKLKYNPAQSWDTQFSKVSVLNMLFYIVAASVWVLETLFDKHREDVDNRLATLIPHTLLWYQQKAKSFLLGQVLMEGTDKYDTSNLSESEIEAASVIKYAACEDIYGKVRVKIAGGSDRQPLPDVQKTAFAEYMQQVKDAGVVIEIINLPADNIYIVMTVYYSPLYLMPDTDADAPDLSSIDGSRTNIVRTLISEHIADLPFNGIYTNQALVDVLQKETGIVIADLHYARSRVYGSQNRYDINAFVKPYSGYFKVANQADINLKFIPYYAN